MNDVVVANKFASYKYSVHGFLAPYVIRFTGVPTLLHNNIIFAESLRDQQYGYFFWVTARIFLRSMILYKISPQWVDDKKEAFVWNLISGVLESATLVGRASSRRA